MPKFVELYVIDLVQAATNVNICSYYRCKKKLILMKARHSIGSASKLTDIKIETIRYYEKINLIDKPSRSEGGNRLYLDDHIRQLQFVKRARQLGFSLDEIKTLLELSASSSDDCSYAKSIADNHLSNVELKIRDLQKLAEVLKSLSDDCQKYSNAARDCPILTSLNL